MVIEHGNIPRAKAPTGKWVVVVKEGEISVVREDDIWHQQTYGWFDLKDKFLITTAGGGANWPFHPVAWGMLKDTAQKFADYLNGHPVDVYF